MTFLLEGNPVRLTRRRPERSDPRSLRSTSGSSVDAAHRATVAVASRSYVEGIHDAGPVEGRRLCRLGWGPDTGAAWEQILRRVNSYSDLDPALPGRVEELIDFVTAPG